MSHKLFHDCRYILRARSFPRVSTLTPINLGTRSCPLSQDAPTIILKNGRSQDFNKISIHKKKPVPKSLFNKVAGAQLTLLWKNKTPIQVFFYEVQKIPLFSYEFRKIYKNIAGWLLLNVIYLKYFERDSNTVVFLWTLRDL